MTRDRKEILQWKPLHSGAGYALASLATGLSALLRWLLPGALSPAPYLGFYPAVVVSAALGGVGPGLVSTFASLLLVNLVFGRFNFQDQGAMIRQVVWVAASIGVSVLAGRLRTARARAEDEAAKARAAEQALQASLHEKEVLLREIHHRVKNNLQVISSLMDLQADTLEDPALPGVFAEMRDRVRSMALVHEKLYQSEGLASVNFSEYARTLLENLWRAHAQAAETIRLKLDLHPVSLSVVTAVPCGLVLNELVINALKHAFRGRSEGEIAVGLSAGPEGRVCLSVSDDGVGLPAGLDWQQADSLGLRLVQLLTSQLEGTLEVKSGRGASFCVAFVPPQPGHSE